MLHSRSINLRHAQEQMSGRRSPPTCVATSLSRAGTHTPCSTSGHGDAATYPLLSRSFWVAHRGCHGCRRARLHRCQSTWPQAGAAADSTAPTPSDVQRYQVRRQHRSSLAQPQPPSELLTYSCTSARIRPCACRASGTDACTASACNPAPLPSILRHSFLTFYLTS